MAKLKQQAEDHHQEEIDHHADAIKELEVTFNDHISHLILIFLP